MENLTILDYSSTYLFEDIADKRVEKWFLMKDPRFAIGIAIIYLFLVLYQLPKYMQTRPAFKIKTILQIYNIIQVVACVYLIYSVATAGWTTHYTFGCQPIDYTEDPIAKKMLDNVYWTFVLKMVEMVETVFFILRKKFNQVTNLHVYHHTSTFMYAWIGTKYFGGGMATFSILINCSVHVLMYSYYFLSSCGPETQKKMMKYKSTITIIQMAQFWIIIIHALQALSPDCPIPNFAAYIYIPNVFVIFGFFLNFYIKSYSKKKTV